MQIRTILLSIALVLLISSQFFAQYYVQESFNYPAGSFIDALGDAGNGWGSGWFIFGEGSNEGIMTVGDTAIAYDDLDYEVPHQGMQVSGANPIAWGFQRYGRYLDKNWPDQAGTTYWISFLCELDHGFTDNGWAGLGLWKDDTTEYKLLGHEWGNGTYGLATYGGETGYTTYRWDSGPVWIVTKFVMTGDTTAERAFMWVNIDPSDAEPDTSSAEAKASFGLNDGFDMVVIHFGGEGVGMTMAMDEIRLGTSWEDVSGELATGVELTTGSIPSEFALAQNYPNPFNPSTTISFSIPQESMITLRVFDIIGREVALLVSGEKVAAGSYTYSFDASGLASGTYFYQLQTDKLVQTRKMLLIK